MATPEERSRDVGPPKVICVGMLRTGTKSMATALSMMGFKHVFHGLDSRTKPSHWAFLEKAAIASWPEVNAKGQSGAAKRFTRQDWDELFGVFDAVTDLSCFWALELADAYPEAKIVLTERDFDKWFPSFDSEVLQLLFAPWVNVFLRGIGTIVGNRAGFAMQKTISGFFGGASTLEELHRAAPAVYRRHSESIKAHIAPERLLVYRVGKDGWKPLCDFLGCDMPEEEFPFANDREAHHQSHQAVRRYWWIAAANIVGKYAAVAAVVGLAWWWLR